MSHPSSKFRIALVAAGALCAGLTLKGAEPPSPPANLRDTGLYSNFATREIDPGNLPYSPQYPLWTDGAKKKRWVYLPPGRKIDASDPDRWNFPVGTKIWKEFAWNRPVETRYLEKVGPDEWIYGAYVWSTDGANAVLAPPEGVRGAYPLAPGVSHDVPGITDCKACHEGRSTQVLGFDALQLSSDRDPNAPHAAPLAPGEITLSYLVAHHLIEKLPGLVLSKPPRIESSTPLGRAAMGYLHGNCASCHNPDDPLLGNLGMFLKHSALVRAEDEEPVMQTAVGKASRFPVPGLPPGQTKRIQQGAPEQSAVVYRMGSRNPFKQMPPLGTKIVDEEGLALLKRWIQEDLKSPNHQ